MAVAKKTEDLSTDLDDLLNFDDVITDAAVSVEPAAAVEPEVVAETAEQIKIRELTAELAKPAPPVLAPTQDVTGRPLDTSVLTPDQIRIRDLEHQLAQKKTKELDSAPERFESVAGGETILIHFLEDGFTAQGRVWFKGQELEFVVGGQAHNETKDRNGRSWLEDDDSDQLDSADGIIYFRKGPWPGKSYEDKNAEAKERSRKRAAPVLTS